MRERGLTFGTYSALIEDLALLKLATLQTAETNVDAGALPRLDNILIGSARRAPKLLFFASNMSERHVKYSDAIQKRDARYIISEIIGPRRTRDGIISTMERK